jgi:hypothetical protein
MSTLYSLQTRTWLCLKTKGLEELEEIERETLRADKFYDRIVVVTKNRLKSSLFGIAKLLEIIQAQQLQLITITFKFKETHWRIATIQFRAVKNQLRLLSLYFFERVL